MYGVSYREGWVCTETFEFPGYHTPLGPLDSLLAEGEIARSHERTKL
jgi:hypothetical protein